MECQGQLLKGVPRRPLAQWQECRCGIHLEGIAVERRSCGLVGSSDSERARRVLGARCLHAPAGRADACRRSVHQGEVPPSRTSADGALQDVCRGCRFCSEIPALATGRRRHPRGLVIAAPARAGASSCVCARCAAAPSLPSASRSKVEEHLTRGPSRTCVRTCSGGSAHRFPEARRAGG